MTTTYALDAAGTHRLGGREVRRIGFGAMQLPGRGVMGPPRDKDQAIAVLRRAVEAGVNHIDTAQFYGPEVANELIREALHPYADDLVIVSKVGAVRDAKGGWPPAQRPEELRAGVEDNLRTLKVDRLGAVNLRRMDHPIDDPAQQVPLLEQLHELEALRSEGKIDGIGVSTVTLSEVNAAIATVGITCVQNAYSLLDRTSEPVLRRCSEAGVAFVPYFPLGSAFPHLPKVVDQPVVQEIARAHEATPAQVGLAWLLAHSPDVLLIPGTSSLEHLEDNLGVVGVQLSDEDVARLDALG